MQLSKETILHNVKENRFKHKHFSQEKIDTISQSNLIQLTYWIDETLLEERNRRFYLAAKENIIIYENMAYDHYTGESFPPLLFLQRYLGFTFPQAVYLLNHFYYKVPKAPLRAELSATGAQSHAQGCNHDLDLNYILAADKLTSPADKTYTLRRVIAYLCDTRRIDKDLVLHFIKQGYLKVDSTNNLCFITYADPLTKDEVIAITKRGTMTAAPYKCNLTKEYNTGFFYARAADLRAGEYQTAFVFESAIDLLSYLSLVKQGHLASPEEGESCCYLSMNGAGNRACLRRLMGQYPTITQVNLCLDNDTKGIEAAHRITAELERSAPAVIAEDFQPTLKALSFHNRYCKDWNDAARLAAETGELKTA